MGADWKSMGAPAVTFEVYKRSRRRGGRPALQGWRVTSNYLLLGPGEARLSGLRNGDEVVMLYDRETGMVACTKAKAPDRGWIVSELPNGTIKIRCTQFLQQLPFLSKLPRYFKYEAVGYMGGPEPGFRLKKENNP